MPERLQRQAVHAVLRMYRYHTPDDASVDMTPIRQACWTEDALDIVYRSAENGERAPRVLPQSMVYVDDAVMSLAWCTLRDDFRMFRVSRVVELPASTESFRPRRVALLRDCLQRLSGK